MERKLLTKYDKLSLYQIYPSNNQFHCYGLCVSGPDRISFRSIVAIVLVPMFIFVIFQAPYLWKQVNPLIVIISLWSFPFHVINFFVIHDLIIFSFQLTDKSKQKKIQRAAYSDPGIVPRKSLVLKRSQNTTTSEDQKSITVQIRVDPKHFLLIRIASWSKYLLSNHHFFTLRHNQLNLIFARLAKFLNLLDRLIVVFVTITYLNLIIIVHG